MREEYIYFCFTAINHPFYMLRFILVTTRKRFEAITFDNVLVFYEVIRTRVKLQPHSYSRCTRLTKFISRLIFLLRRLKTNIGVERSTAERVKAPSDITWESLHPIGRRVSHPSSLAASPSALTRAQQLQT